MMLKKSDIKIVKEMQDEMNEFLMNELTIEKPLKPKGLLLYFLIKFSELQNRIEVLEKNPKVMQLQNNINKKDRYVKFKKIKKYN